MFALVKPFLIAIMFIVFLLFVIGIFKVEKTSYSCTNGKKLHFASKVILLDMGRFKVYGYPIVSDCPLEQRYDPKTVYKCGEAYCRKEMQ